MISYDPLWDTMRRKGITQYALIHKHHISPGQITRLKRNESVSTHTINMFCDLLDCQVEDIMVYIRTNETENEPEVLDFIAESSNRGKTGLKSAENSLLYDGEPTTGDKSSP